jgi:hypothetical protein
MMLTKTIATKCNPREQAPVTVALAYDGDAAFRAAREVYLGVARSLAGEFEFRDFWWRFDALVEQTLFERAVGIAAEADIVFCCPGNPHVLPRAVQDWICRWLTRRTQPDGALVILLPVVTGTSPSPTLLEALPTSRITTRLNIPSTHQRARPHRKPFSARTWMSSALFNMEQA